MKVYYAWYEYPVGQGAYGSGGWSRNAKRRPAPVIKQGVGMAEPKGKSWIVNGVRRLKLCLWSLEDGSQVRADYDIPMPAFLKEPVLRAIRASEVAS